jgi:hypothetical protein
MQEYFIQYTEDLKLQENIGKLEKCWNLDAYEH